MNTSWRKQRQIIIFTTYFLIIFIPFSILAYNLFQRGPTCYDNVQNGDEEGVDCNGSCQLRCDGTYRDLKVNFSRGLKVDENIYDVVAVVENFNTQVSFPKVPYNISFYGLGGNLLGNATGTFFAEPQRKAVIYLPSLFLSEAPKTIEFNLGEHLAVINNKEIPALVSVDSWQSQRGANNSLQVVGELENPYNYEVFDMSVYAFLYDDTRTVYAVSKTKVPSLKGREKTGVAFTWGNIKVPDNVEFVIVFNE